MKNGNFPKRGEIFWVALDPTIGSEIQNTRPCLIVSNDYANELDVRVIILPITSKVARIYSFEVPITIGAKAGKILTDQVRSIDKMRLGKKIGLADDEIMSKIDSALRMVLGLEF